MKLVAYDESYLQNLHRIFVGIWIIINNAPETKILCVKDSVVGNWHIDKQNIMASSLKCFYVSEIRNKLEIKNLSWDCQWDCQWDGDDTTIFIDGSGNWNCLDEQIKKQILSNKVEYQYCSKEEQKDFNSPCRWVGCVDKWLNQIKKDLKVGKSLCEMFELHMTFDNMKVHVEHIKNENS